MADRVGLACATLRPPCAALPLRVEPEGFVHRTSIRHFRKAFALAKMADRVGFEPTVGLHLRRFSRPLP